MAPAPSLDVHAAALEIKAAQDGVHQVETYTARVPGFDERAAYAVADVVHRLRLEEGDVPLGRKIGFTNRALWDEYGVRVPIWGYVYARTTTFITAARAECRLASYAEPRIEPEIVVHFRRAPPQSGSVADILACVDWFAHGYEIVQSHYPGWRFRAADTIADAALHGALLIGEPRGVAALGPVLIEAQASFAIELSCDGRLRAQGRGSNVLGSPLDAVAHLIAVLARDESAAPLADGELVTTGTLTPALPVAPGETWTTRIAGLALPGLSVTFV